MREFFGRCGFPLSRCRILLDARIDLSLSLVDLAAVRASSVRVFVLLT
jgi:hypothetical protein